MRKGGRVSMRKFHRLTVTTLLLTALLVFIGLCQPQLAPATAETTPPTPTLVVSGLGTVSVAPDEGKVVLAVVTTDKLLAEALDRNTAATNKVVAALTDDGIKSDQIETSNFSVWPQYSYPGENDKDRPPVIVGYQVRNEITVTVQDLARLGKIVDSALKTGANEVVSISYEKQDSSQAVNLALKKACQQANAKAQAIAAALGVQLGRVVSVTESTSSYNPSPPFQALKATSGYGAGDVPIQPGKLQVTATVNITFELK